LSIYDAIDVVRFVDDTAYTTIINKVSDKASLRGDLETNMRTMGAYTGLVETFELYNEIPYWKLENLKERLS